MKILPNTPTTLKIPLNSFRGEANIGDVILMPGFNKVKADNIIFRPTGGNIRYIMHNWPEAEWVHTAKKTKKDFLEMEAKHKEVVEEKNRDVDVTTYVNTITDYTFKRLPKKHQAKALELSTDKKLFALFMKQGTGKTKVTLDNAGILYKRGEIDTLVVIAWPNGIHRNWVDYEIPEDINEDIKYKALYWKPGNKKRVKEMLELSNKKGILKIFTFNVDAVNTKDGKLVLEEILYNNKNNMVVIDQSACIKNHASNRTEYIVKELSKLAKYRRILDGDPVAEGVGELYSQMNFLDNKIIGHDSWTAFKAEFCRVGFFNNIEGYKNIDELQRRIAPYSLRIGDDVLDLPDRVWRRWKFDLHDEELRIFNELKRKDIAFFEKQMIDETEEGLEIENAVKMVVPLALTKHTRLQQVSSGFFYDSDKKELITISEKSSRMLALKQLVEHIGKKDKVLIFARFSRDIKNIAEELGGLTFYGGTSDDDRSINKEKFIKGDEQFLIGHPGVMGIGHTFTVAKHIIFYNNHPALRLRIEAEKRAHRMGLTWSLNIWDLIASKTTDQKGLDALKAKKSISDLILEDPDDFFLVENENE